MLRAFFVATLLFTMPAVMAAQGFYPPAANPLVHDPFWRFYVGAEAYAQAKRVLSGNASAIEAMSANFTMGSPAGALRAARRLLTATPRELATGLRLLHERSHEFNDDGTTNHAELVAFVTDARRRIEGLTREDGAEPALPLLWLEYNLDRGDEDAHQKRIDAFLQKYAGTAAATEFKVSQVESGNSRDYDAQLQRFRDLAREHDKTVAGAMALHLLGFRQGHPSSPGPDPTERLLEVFDIVKQLESGRFPPCRWVADAGELVSDFYFDSQTRIPAESIPRLYSGYLQFVLSHQNLRSRFAGGDPIDSIIRNGVARLDPTGPDRIATVERFFADLEQGGFGVNEVRSARARFYRVLASPRMLSPDTAPLISPKEAEERAHQSLRLMIESANPTAVARGLAGLGEYAALAQRFPTADWTWVAAMRAVEARETKGDLAGAAADYESIATGAAANRVAVVLARIAAGDTWEASGRFAAAAANFQAAVDAWVDMPELIRMVSLEDSAVSRRFADVKRPSLVTRAGRLAAVVGPEGELLHTARRAIENERPREAIAPLERIRKEFPRSTTAVEATALLLRARLEAALMEDGSRTRERELERLANGQFDSVAAVARLAQAALMLRRQDGRKAEALTKATLERWQASPSQPSPPATALDRDVASIRAALFLPRGGGVFGHGGWNAFEWPTTSAWFIVMNRDVLVKTADGRETTSAVTFAPPAGDRVLFLAPEDRRALRLILDHIGGTETREWVNATEVPNQPLGASVEIAALWAKFFHVRPGHWGGWELTTYPALSRITFDREGHALADFTIGYSGGTVELEKENGVWVAKRIVSTWIT